MQQLRFFRTHGGHHTPFIRWLAASVFAKSYCALITSVLNALLDDGLRDFVLFGYLTGMRKGEIASLRWEFVRDGEIVLPGEYAKTGKPRAIPIEGDIADLVKRREAARSFKQGEVVHLSQFLFHRGDGVPIREFRKTMACGSEKSGMSHEAISRPAANGLPRHDPRWGTATGGNVDHRPHHDCNFSAIQHHKRRRSKEGSARDCGVSCCAREENRRNFPLIATKNGYSAISSKKEGLPDSEQPFFFSII